MLTQEILSTRRCRGAQNETFSVEQCFPRPISRTHLLFAVNKLRAISVECMQQPSVTPITTNNGNPTTKRFDAFQVSISSAIFPSAHLCSSCPCRTGITLQGRGEGKLRVDIHLSLHAPVSLSTSLTFLNRMVVPCF